MYDGNEKASTDPQTFGGGRGASRAIEMEKGRQMHYSRWEAESMKLRSSCPCVCSKA